MYCVFLLFAFFRAYMCVALQVLRHHCEPHLCALTVPSGTLTTSEKVSVINSAGAQEWMQGSGEHKHMMVLVSNTQQQTGR